MVQEFLNYQATNKGLAEETIYGYQKDLKAFIGWAQPKGLRWSTITPTDMEAYVQDERERGMMPATIKKRIEVVRLIFSWAQHRGMLTANPAQYTQAPKAAKTLRQAADAKQLEDYMQSPSLTRDAYLIHAVVAIIYETGIRIGELLKIEGKDIDPDQRAIKIHGKGANERIVYYGERSAKYLQAMSYRRGRCLEETDAEIRCKMAKEIRGCHPHAIRHTFACRMLNAGMPLKTLSTLMGHEHEATTEIYARMATDKMRAEYQKYN